jgi:hypothetical protein
MQESLRAGWENHMHGGWRTLVDTGEVFEQVRDWPVLKCIPGVFGKQDCQR